MGEIIFFPQERPLLGELVQEPSNAAPYVHRREDEIKDLLNALHDEIDIVLLSIEDLETFAGSLDQPEVRRVLQDIVQCIRDVLTLNRTLLTLGSDLLTRTGTRQLLRG